MSRLGMKKDMSTIVCGVKLLPDEISEAKDYIYDEYSVVIHMWSREKLDQAIADFWLNRGKEPEENEEDED